MNLPKKIPLVAVIGHPIAHSASPKLHNFWLKRHEIPGFYVPMDVEPQNLALVLQNLHKMGFVGANITIPHKEEVLKIADKITDRAALIGAANTLVFKEDGQIFADNTDGVGFIENLRQNAPNWQPNAGPAIVLGAGGAARAIISALLEAGVPEIHLFNRTKARADELKRVFGPRVKVDDWDLIKNSMPEAMTLVNTTALGMAGKSELLIDLAPLNPKCLVTDIVYTPLKTALLQQAEARGLQIVDGLGMLLHQAVPGFERWFGQKPQVDDETRDLVLQK